MAMETGTALAALTAATLAGVATSLVLLRARRREQARLVALENETERLQDRVWQLAESEEHYRSLIEAQGDLIVRTNAAGRITYANEAFARLTGRAREDLIGSAYAAAGEGPDTAARHMRDGAHLFDQAVATPDGPRWIAWVETAVPSAAGAERQRVGRDITDRREAERALEEARTRAEAASEAKSRFLATVSHEVRTPLNGILGMADLLAATRLDPEQSTYVRALKTSGEVLLSLIDEILDFSRVEAGKLALVAAPFDLRTLVEGVVELLAPRAQGKGIEIAASVARDVPRTVLGDGDRLRQVLMNLAGNAVKFTDHGGVGLSVAALADGRLRFSVADTGPGIAPEQLSAIFGEFEQADDSASRRHGGTGLGLAISRGIVEQMGGRIAVASEVGRGSTFTFTLDLPAADGGEAGEATPDLGGRHVILVARSPFEARFVAARLSEAGAIVEQPAPGEEAARRLAAGSSTDILLADCALGEEAVRDLAAIARRGGIGRSLVLLSPFERRGFGPPSAAGFDGYLVKPVRPRSLFQQVAAEGGPGEPGGTAAARAAAAAPTGDDGSAAVRVLLAEDNEINALVALKALQLLGARGDWARNGAEALTLADKALSGAAPPYDLVLTDVRMPGIDGLELVRRLRAREAAAGRGAPMRIVMLTANAFEEDRAAAQAAGADGFLAKPLDSEALRRWLAPTQARRTKAS